MRTHIQAHSGLQPFKCDLCPKTFAYSRCVTHHRITHSARKPYTCLRCGKSYTLLGTLQTHHLLHEHQDALNKDGVVVKEDTVKEEGPGVVNDAESKNSKYPTFFRYKCPDCPRCFRMSSQVPVHRYVWPSIQFGLNSIQLNFIYRLRGNYDSLYACLDVAS